MFSLKKFNFLNSFSPLQLFCLFIFWKYSSLCLLSFFIHSASCSATETVQLSTCSAFCALSAFSFSAFSAFQQYIQQISLRPSAFTLYFCRKCNLSSYQNNIIKHWRIITSPLDIKTLTLTHWTCMSRLKCSWHHQTSGMLLFWPNISGSCCRIPL